MALGTRRRDKWVHKIRWYCGCYHEHGIMIGKRHAKRNMAKRDRRDAKKEIQNND